MSKDATSGISRRTFIATTGVAGATALAGCTTGSGSDNNAGGDTTDSSGDEGSETSALTADGSSTVYPITNTASSLWNGNPPASDEEYWGPGQYDIDTDENLADYFASLYGFEPTGSRSNPPFSVNVALSHSGTGVKAVKEGRVDIGDSSAPVSDELPDASEETIDNFVDHVVGVDGQPIVVSKEIYDAGVTKVTGEELKKIYKAEITNWSEIGGPDKDIKAIGRAEGSGTDTAFRANLYGDPDAPIEPDIRKGQNQQVKTLVEQSDNAIAYLALAFVNDGGEIEPIALEMDGTTYELGKNLGAKEYPLSRDLHCYTWEDTSNKEAAFLNMILTEFGQEKFVAANNYFKLPEERRQKQLEKLPDQA